MKAHFIPWVFATLMSGCGIYREFDQTVVVSVSGPVSSIQNLSLRYYSGKGCSGAFQQFVLAPDGKASIHRIARRGIYIVFLESPSLCHFKAQKWNPVWQATIDPPDRQAFQCIVDQEGPPVCSIVSSPRTGAYQ